MERESGYTRKKQPDLVRRALLDEAARLSVEQGLAAVTVQAVSDAAGVTKGGFMHHFPSKQALIDAVFQDMLEAIDHDLDARIAADSEAYGCFTRAYVEAVFDAEKDLGTGPWAPISISMLTDANLRALWAQWFDARVERHRETDSDLQLAITRLAADGLWLADMAGIALPDRALLRERLVGTTRG